MKIAFFASARPAAQTALEELTDRYGQTALPDADYIVAIGGDGTTLKVLQATLSMSPKPVFAMRTQGSVGFLANALHTDDLIERLRSGRTTTLHPLRADIEQTCGRASVDGCGARLTADAHMAVDGDVRRDLVAAQIGNELPNVVSLVGPKRDPLSTRSVGD